MDPRPTLIDIVKARTVIRSYLRPTPLYRAPALSQMLGIDLFIKYENHQPIRSFKVRGALYRMSLLSKEERPYGVVTASTGNHGQGIAYAASVLGVPATVIVPHGTPLVKTAPIEQLGGRLLVFGHDIAEGFEKAKEIAVETGAVYIEDGDDAGLMAGAGTIGLEIIEDLPGTDVIVVPVGGGNLIAGLSLAAKRLNPAVRIIGVQAEKAPSVYLSWKRGRLVTTDSCDTFAGGLATRYPGGLAFSVLKNLVDEIHLVTENEMRQAILLVLEKTGYVAEGAGAAPFALCLKRAHTWAGRHVVALFSGGNLAPEMLREIMQAYG